MGTGLQGVFELGDNGRVGSGGGDTGFARVGISETGGGEDGEEALRSKGVIEGARASGSLGRGGSENCPFQSGEGGSTRKTGGGGEVGMSVELWGGGAI